MILGITGGTGCGKTTLLAEIAQKGGLVLDCDAIYHELLRDDKALLQRIADRFPGTVEDGVLQRKKLGEIVFGDEQALLALNEITHSAVRSVVEREIAASKVPTAIDAIALFESGLQTLCDRTVAVTAPREDRIRRLIARDGISEDYAAKRIDAQHPDAWFREKCDDILENAGTEQAFRAEVRRYLKTVGMFEEESV